VPMTINTAWLMEYLEPGCTHEELLDALPRVGLEIEERHELRSELESVRIGFVRDKKPLAGSGGMYACQIEIERGIVISVVCASEHEIRVGWGVPVARAGAVLPTGAPIKEAMFHGVQSVGMICLDGEMGMVARNSGMQYFTDEGALGMPLPSVAAISEYLIIVNVLPNRPDFLGLIGIARDVAALLRLKLRYPQTLSPSSSGAKGRDAVAVQVREPELCPRYMCRIVRDVQVRPSPAFLKARLLLAGMKPINNIVDVTNYVLYEYGQPLHAFDLATLHGPQIVVRTMTPGEKLTLLNDKAVSADAPGLSRPPLVIADKDRPIALAGIMGGAPTQITGQTRDILVEAAYFDPVNIRRTVRELNVGVEGRGTDSSYRFERGTDPNCMLEGALGRALQLITEVAGGTVADGAADHYPRKINPRTLHLAAGQTGACLGMPVEESIVRDCLQRLDMRCEQQPSGIDVQVPTWRADANDAVVLIEDVARIIGYDQVPTAAQNNHPTLGMRAPSDRLRQTASEFLADAGFFECRSPSLEAPELTAWLGAPASQIHLRNAATDEMSVLRRSLLPALARAADHNLRHAASSIRLFEVDRVFDAPKENSDQASSQRWMIGGLTGGPASASNWRGGANATDFFLVKGVVEDLLQAVGCRSFVMTPIDAKPLMAGTAAEISVEQEGQRLVIGRIGQLDISLFRFERVSFPLLAFELDLEALEKTAASGALYKPVPRVPAVTRDLAIILPTSIAYADLLASIHQSAGPTLQSIELVDRYQGSQVPKGQQSLAFHLVFRDPQRTLRAEEVTAVMDQIIKSLSERFGAQLRA
jgi:phenylalanyl-tRNA synthetase beta chain